jgi:hypothetical protein
MTSPQQPSTVEAAIEEWGKRFEPATSSRGQGGLPLHGSVTDWKLTLTEDGWEHHKAALVAALNELRRQDMEYVIGKDFDIAAEMNKQARDFALLDRIMKYGTALNSLKADQRKRLEERLNEPE